MKYFSFKRYKFSTILKGINHTRYKISQILKYADFRRYNFYKITRYIDFRSYNFAKILKYINLRKYNYSKLYKLINIKRNKYNFIYTFSAIILLLLVFLNIPLFYNYDKKNVENIFCKDFHVKCTIQGKIRYSFFPSPRFKINNLIINDFVDEKQVIGNIKNIELTIPLKNLYKKVFIYKKVSSKNFEINFNLEKITDYKNYFKKKSFIKPFNFKSGEINFYDDKNKISSIKNVKLKYRPSNNTDKLNLKGIFLNDKIDLTLKNNKKAQDSFKILTIDLEKNAIFTKIKTYNPNSDKDTFSGDLAFKKGKNRLTAFFDYKDNKLIFKESKIRNALLDGEFNGELSFQPYLNFDLNLDLKGVNFNKLHTYLINLDDKSKKNLFAVSKKINGQLNFSANKIYSKFNLIKSFESQLKFINGSILINRLLLNLGKIGAADLSGIIENDKKFSNLKFESNVYVDNKKKFISKLGVYGQKNISSNFYFSGNLDLFNLRILFNEISGKEDFTQEDINYIQKEFNSIFFEKGYESFFDFPNLKEFIKSVSSTE